MGGKTGISWCDHTFNPWWGCTKVSPGCDHCYAERVSRRYGHALWGRGIPRPAFGEAHWREPVKWDRAAEKAGRRALVFCASMADFLDVEAPEEERWRLWDLIRATPNLLWLLLTKRPARSRSVVPDDILRAENVLPGVSIEDGDYSWRVTAMAEQWQRPGFVSAEPLLGPVTPHRGWPDDVAWVIAGGESGSGARPSRVEWFRILRDWCLREGKQFHFKQWGEHNEDGKRVGLARAGRLLDGEVWDERPRERKS